MRISSSGEGFMSKLQSMQTFIQVAERGSFAAAAEYLGLTRSSVTRQIAALEDGLGIQLLVRTTRSQSLTNAGLRYLETCRAVLDIVERSEAELIDEQVKPKGNIRISLPLSYGLKHLTDFLMDFANLHPEISLDLRYNDRKVDVAEESFDLAIRIAGELALSDIVRRLGSCSLYFVAAPAYLQEHGEPKHPQDLCNHACLQYGRQQEWTFRDGGELVTVPISGRIIANNGDALAKASALGMGVSLMPDFIAQEYLDDGRLQRILSDFSIDTVGIYAVLPANTYVPNRVQKLVAFLHGRLQPR